MENLKAIIYKSTGSWYKATDTSGRLWNCRLKGKLKIDGNITSTNPIAVGDIVHIESENELENTATIFAIDARKNHIVRTSPHNRNQQHIIASNLDQAILIASIKQPKTSLGFIDRFLVTAEMYDVKPIIVFNKIDLLDEHDEQILNHYISIYKTIGYQVICISVFANTNMEAIKDVIANKSTLFTGHSGVGKSTVINALLPNLDLRVTAVSDWSGKGMHTTTYAEMFDLPKGGKIIDTPGIRELGVMGVTKPELSGYFPEISIIAKQCKYNNCMHINEPHCAVLTAIEKETISSERYISYRAILDSIDDKGY